MKSQAQGYITEIIGASMRECVGWVEGDKHSWAVAQAEDSECENVRRFIMAKMKQGMFCQRRLDQSLARSLSVGCCVSYSAEQQIRSPASMQAGG
ncbi:uncharacterized [Tachysurus ichikawai]